MLNKKISSLFVVVALFLLLLPGCAVKDNSFKVSKSPELDSNIKKIGIVKFTNKTAYPEAGIKAADIFHKKLAAFNKFELVAPEEMAEKGFGLEFVKMPKDMAGLSNMDYLVGKSSANIKEKKAIEAAKAPELDAIVTGAITRYDNREGSNIAISKPASVAFKVSLIRVEDNKEIWTVSFAETQRALLENLLLIDRFNEAGGVWLTNEELTDIGMQRIIKSFPGLTRGNASISE